MMKRIIIVLLLAIFVCFGLYNIVDAYTSKSKSWPQVSAQSAIVIDAVSGEVLYGKNQDKKSYPASITKILTALVAIELCSDGEGIDKIIEVTPSAVGVEGSSIYLAANEKISVRDLLYGLMLRSGNDAAVALAEGLGGSTEQFVEVMNAKAKEIGASSSNFMNPSGLHDENHFVTASDMAMIAKEAMKHEEFRKIAKEKTWKAQRGEGLNNIFINKNKVVYQYEGATGIKIGFTKSAGRTLVASAKRGNVEVICVVLQAPNWFRDTYALMDYAFANYESVKIAPGEKPLNNVSIAGGIKDPVKVGTKNTVQILKEKGKDSNISIVYSIPRIVEAPVKRWDLAGYLKVYRDKEYIYSEPLYYLEDMERIGP